MSTFAELVNQAVEKAQHIRWEVRERKDNPQNADEVWFNEPVLTRRETEYLLRAYEAELYKLVSMGDDERRRIAG